MPETFGEHMKRIAFAVAALVAASPVLAASEMIDPETYICAELAVTGNSFEAPVFEGLQLDGYAAGLAGAPVADAAIIHPILTQVYDSCSAKPAEKVLAHWQECRKNVVPNDASPWRADGTTCADYAADEDDGSGFVIWLDGYQRAKTGQKKSVFANQETLDHFLAQCKAAPGRLMYDVMVENAR